MSHVIRFPTVLLRIALSAIVVASSFAGNAGAQSIINIDVPKNAALKARAAADAHLAAETGQDVSRGKPAPPAPMAPVSGPASQGAATGARPTSAGVAGSNAMMSGPFSVSREVFNYNHSGRRDPFYSLILTQDLRPLLADLKLVGILYALSGRSSVAIMRDAVTGVQYRVNAGQTLGRMRVAQIRPRAVIFTIDEFGLSRQDSLVMSDTNKVIR